MSQGSSLAMLNPAQRAAATFGERAADGCFRAGPLLVIAGAGTGKTNTLAHRVAQLVLAAADPARILLLTFTRRAAVEMTRRAERIVAESLQGAGGAAAGPAVRLPWSGTFHSVASRLLRQFAPSLGLEPGFSIMDRGDAADLLDLLRHQLGYSRSRRRFPRKDTCLAIYSFRVNTGRELDVVLGESFPWCAEWEPELRALFAAYVERKQANGVLDYDDLLLWWHAMMAEPALARQVGAAFDHVLVDEYQDTNALQAGILHALKPDGAGVTVVGDDAQAIYSFRGATVDNILDFPARFAPPATVITLEHNYRSSQPVLDAANALIGEAGRQYRKQLQATRPGGAAPRLVSVLDDRGQADYVIERVLEAREAGVPLKRQAVLFRSAHHSDVLEVELMRRNIPYVKYGGLKFLEAAHVKDLLAVLRWADNPKNGIAAFRVLQLLPGMGPANAERCVTKLRPRATRCRRWPGSARRRRRRRPGQPSPQLMAALGRRARPLARAGRAAAHWYQPLLEQRYDSAFVRAADLDMLAQVSGQFASRERFLTELTLDPPQATGDLSGPPLLDEDYLILSTVHSAKGQEWDAVYVLNVADGNFPSEFAAGRADQLDEERRLLYVAMTRARDQLHLLEPQRYYVTQQPRSGDGHVYGARSRFLTEGVLATLERAGPGGEPAQDSTPAASAGVVVDVARGCARCGEAGYFAASGLRKRRVKRSLSPMASVPIAIRVAEPQRRGQRPDALVVVLGVRRVGVHLARAEKLEADAGDQLDRVVLTDIARTRLGILRRAVRRGPVLDHAEDAAGLERRVHRLEHGFGAVARHPVVDVAEGQDHVDAAGLHRGHGRRVLQCHHLGLA
jgi:DNA helicase II / ATP-dependent DNA helicase PcrA